MLQTISKRRFDALAGYSRSPQILLLTQEFDWLATPDERVLGIVLWDRIDRDFSWSALARDELQRYRWVEGWTSYPTAEAARDALVDALERLARAPDTEFYQGDTKGKPMDFFRSGTPERKLHATYHILSRAERYRPAKELIQAMMRHHVDVDGNFVEQFQTTAFNARLWELYLFATLVELNYAREPDIAVPDFVVSGTRGQLAIEATTINPSEGYAQQPLRTKEEVSDYMDNYIPIRLARALREKMKKKYWEQLHMNGRPLIFAVQDFHRQGIMRVMDHAATEYLYGFSNRMVDGKLQLQKIGEHRYKTLKEPSGFFNFPETEHISAVLINPTGTLLKFNRMGYIAGFGPREIKMVRSGVRRAVHDFDGQPLKEFVQDVQSSLSGHQRRNHFPGRGDARHRDFPARRIRRSPRRLAQVSW